MGEVLTTVVASTVPGQHPMIEVAPGRPRSGFLGIGRPDPRTVVTGVPAFDTRFTLVADDPAHAARTVDPSVIAWLAADPRAALVGFRLHGSWLVCWAPGGAEPSRIDMLLGFLEELRSRMSAVGTPA